MPKCRLNTIRTVLLVCGLLAAIGLVKAPPAAAASSTTLSPSTVELGAGQSATITIQVAGLAANVNGAQWGVVHPTDGSVSVSGPACTGVFAGAAVLGPSAQPYGTLIGCALLSGSTTATTGDAITFTLTRASGNAVIAVSLQVADVIYTRTNATIETGGQFNTLTVNPPGASCILGDINCDGIVDIRDYGLWRLHFGETAAVAASSRATAGAAASSSATTGAAASGRAAAAVLIGDLNLDGIVDIRDYGIWRENFGRTAGAAAPAA